MRDLLPDNMALGEHLEALPTCLGQPHRQAEQREVGSLITWISSFATYVAVISQTHPDRVTDMLAYMRLIIREAHKHGGQGWLTYDSLSPQPPRSIGALEHLDPSLHTAYIAGQSLPPRVPCKHCNETDHFPEDCALAPLIPSVRPSQRKRQLPFARPPNCPASAGTAQGVQKRLCISWNGTMRIPGSLFLQTLLCPMRQLGA